MLWKQATYYLCTGKTGINNKTGSPAFITNADAQVQAGKIWEPGNKGFL